MSQPYEIIIIGAGFAGIGAAIQLKKMNAHFLLLEKSSEIGGVWRDNNYPGCGCDVPSPLYSYSFSPNPNWTHLFGKQDEIKQYTLDTADKFGINDHIRTNTELLKSSWDETNHHWRIETTQETYKAKFIIMACGPMHVPIIPKIPGLETFTGKYFHSSHWDYNCNLKDKRVAVIGSGASAIQFVPKIYPEVKELSLFQRTAPWVLPKADLIFSDQWKKTFAKYPITQKILRLFIYYLFEVFNASLKYPWLAKKIQVSGIKNIYRGVKDPELRKRLIPSFAIGCKRILLSNTWYKTLGKTNVHVLSGIKKIDGSTLYSQDDQNSEADVIIFGTGFEVTTMPITQRIFGVSGKSLSERFDGSPQAYLGTMTEDCPNLFLTFGPNLYTYTSAFVIFEVQLKFITSAIQTARKKTLSSISVKPELLTEFNHEIQYSLKKSIWSSGCTSYFLDKKGNNNTTWPWTSFYMRYRLRKFQHNDYITK